MYQIILFLASLLSLPAHAELATTFKNEELLNKISSFATHVLRLQTQKEWSESISAIRTIDNPITTKDWYNSIADKCSGNPLTHFIKKYKTLKFQQKLLAQQIKQLVPFRSINGYVEIGSPCRYVDYLKDSYTMTGKSYTINYNTSITDILESKSCHIQTQLNPYDTFIPLNDYEPISDTVVDESIDMVVCTIGLHHIPTNKIDPFIASIKRILRPGGVFILRDHDAHDQTIVELADSAHSIFNAAFDNISFEENEQEFRNFQPLSYWKKLLTQSGFQINPLEILQEGDTTLNTMICCEKPMNDEDRFINTMHQQKKYVRFAHQTFLTAPEWFNVYCSQAYGEFINHTPWYEFPYIESIKTYWSIFKNSYHEARKYDSFKTIAWKNDYLLMSLFVGAFMTVEYGAKSLVAWPVRKASQGTAEDSITLLIKDYHLINLEQSPVKIVQTDSTDTIAAYKVNRYKDFQTCLQYLSSTDCSIIEIGGQKIINITVKYPQNFPSELQESVKNNKGTISQTWNVPTQSYTYASVILNVNHLLNFIKDASNKKFDIVYTHDF